MIGNTEFIRKKAGERRVKWSIHALGELSGEPVTTRDVERALEKAKIIELYPHQRRFLPDCLVLAYDIYGNPIHCVVAINVQQDFILIVTVYQPDEESWEDDWKTRK
ncbi:MAG: DUF4258 domain-containing protein [Chloroflexota bacterium]|nr:DUF4258 domain-containing protein [Chloroflexota bacterium]